MSQKVPRTCKMLIALADLMSLITSNSMQLRSVLESKLKSIPVEGVAHMTLLIVAMCS